MKSKLCKCGNKRRKNQTDCHSCHAYSMRKHRALFEPSEKQRIRSATRAYARVYLRRGKIARKPCETCGAKKVEMHHDDYSQPLNVRWFCKTCHHDHHAIQLRNIALLA